MKTFLVVALFLVGFAAAQVDNPAYGRKNFPSKDATCEAKVNNCCGNQDDCEFECSTLILDADKYDDFVKLANDHIIRSYEYLFLSAQFGTYSKDRPGFEKVLHGLSDGTWGKGIEMIQEISKRGVKHSFKNANDNAITAHGPLNEVEAIAKAAEIEKKLLIRANDVHRHHSRAILSDANAKSYDAGLAHYMEEEVIGGKIDSLRTLVGYVNELKNLFKKNYNVFALSLHLFDQFLMK